MLSSLFAPSVNQANAVRGSADAREPAASRDNRLLNLIVA
jgi:hypothetical protein